MFALTVDQQGSRGGPDRVPGLLAALADLPAALPFERTAGDEVQGLIALPYVVIDAVERVVRSGEWSIGVGVGAIERPLGDSVRAARGDALIRAREAVERAKKSPPTRVALSGEGAEDAEAVMRLVALVLQRRKAAQWRVIDAVRRSPDRAAAARELGISVQAISKSLLTSSADVVDDVYPLLAQLLSEADERSE